MDRPEAIVASLKMLKKPKTEQEKYLSRLTTGVVIDEEMDEISEQDEIDDATTIKLTGNEIKGSIAPDGNPEKDSDEEDKKENETPIVEDLTDIKDCTTVTVIDDWDRRFRLANYTEEQRRVVHKSMKKMEEWYATRDADGWTLQKDSDGLTVY